MVQLNLVQFRSRVEDAHVDEAVDSVERQVQVLQVGQNLADFRNPGDVAVVEGDAGGRDDVFEGWREQRQLVVLDVDGVKRVGRLVEGVAGDAGQGVAVAHEGGDAVGEFFVVYRVDVVTLETLYIIIIHRAIYVLTTH